MELLKEEKGVTLVEGFASNDTSVYHFGIFLGNVSTNGNC